MSPLKYALCLILTVTVNEPSFADARGTVADSTIGTTNDVATGSTSAMLGELIFFDRSLSKTGNQACATCHDPANAFIDPRMNDTEGAVSLGDDKTSLGSRNTPSISYAALTPDFAIDQDGYVGGFFLDGRSATLAEQALEPFINPLEMALPSHADLVNKITSKPVYRTLLTTIVGDTSANREARILATVGQALAAFQQTKTFTTFDSKYDRFLAGEVELSALEERGRSLFFSQLANCSQCHMLNTASVKANETFTNYRYHNIGVPRNEQVDKLSADRTALPDLGLYNNPNVSSDSERGKFKVPSLRNVAVTAPYMHNGVFKKLATAVHYYNQFIVRNPDTKTNPETGEPWRAPEVRDNVSTEILSQGQPMDKQRIAAIVAFLKTLTDKRYEALLE